MTAENSEILNTNKNAWFNYLVLSISASDESICDLPQINISLPGPLPGQLCSALKQSTTFKTSA